MKQETPSLNLDLNFIYQTCLDHFGYEFNNKSRKTKMVYARALYYFMSKKYTSLSLREIGSVFGKDHTSVRNAIIKIDTFNDFREFKLAKMMVGSVLREYFNMKILDEEKRHKPDEIIKLERQLNYYYIQYETQKRKNEVLSRIIFNNNTCEVEKLIRIMRDDELQEFKKYRLIPFLKMHKKYNLTQST